MIGLSSLARESNVDWPTGLSVSSPVWHGYNYAERDAGASRQASNYDSKKPRHAFCGSNVSDKQMASVQVRGTLNTTGVPCSLGCSYVRLSAVCALCRKLHHVVLFVQHHQSSILCLLSCFVYQFKVVHHEAWQCGSNVKINEF